MDDLELRNLVYERFVELGRAPTAAELGTTEAALTRLHEAHMLVLEPGTAEIRMVNPFSAVPTPHRVEAGGRSWFANCGWDAFGIPAALGVDGHISSSAPTAASRSRSTWSTGGRNRRTPCSTWSCPRGSWWDDIVFT